MKSLNSVLLSLILLFSTISQATEQANESKAETLQRLDWSLKNLDGDLIKQSDFDGKPVLLVFWATWCPYCKKLFPGVNKVYEKYKDQGFTVIGMNIREDGDPKSYMDERGFKFETTLESDAVAAEYGIRGTPALIFISKTGEVLGQANFSDPEHPALEYFAKEQLGLLEEDSTE